MQDLNTVEQLDADKLPEEAIQALKILDELDRTKR